MTNRLALAALSLVLAAGSVAAAGDANAYTCKPAAGHHTCARPVYPVRGGHGAAPIGQRQAHRLPVAQFKAGNPFAPWGN